MWKIIRIGRFRASDTCLAQTNHLVCCNQVPKKGRFRECIDTRTPEAGNVNP